MMRKLATAGNDVVDASVTSSTQAFYLQGQFSIPVLVAQELGKAGPECLLAHLRSNATSEVVDSAFPDEILALPRDPRPMMGITPAWLALLAQAFGVPEVGDVSKAIDRLCQRSMSEATAVKLQYSSLAKTLLYIVLHRQVDYCSTLCGSTIGALIIRKGFWGILYYNYNKEPPK